MLTRGALDMLQAEAVDAEYVAERDGPTAP